jgi:hypothetical protein
VNGLPDPMLPANEVAFQINPGVASVLAKGMAQNRGQRYETAAEMRTALSDAASGVTVPDREAATVLLAGAAGVGTTVGALPSEQPTALVGDRRTAMATERQTAVAETVTRVHPQEPGRSGLWKGLVAAGLLLACAGGFYGYRLIRNRTATDSSTITQPAETNPNPTSQPVAESNGAPSADGSKVEGVKPATEAPEQRIVIMGPKGSKQNPPVSGRKTNDPQEHRPETPAAPQTGTGISTGAGGQPANTGNYPFPNRPMTPNVTPGRVENLPGGVVVRTLPDGTQIVTQPNGRRIVTRPNGNSRVFGPNGAPIRRPLRRRSP